MVGVGLLARELKLGDECEVKSDGPYKTAVVWRIRDGKVYFCRPYAAVDGIGSDDTVARYLGKETMEFDLADEHRRFRTWVRTA